jgi:hypothetical protein
MLTAGCSSQALNPSTSALPTPAAVVSFGSGLPSGIANATSGDRAAWGPPGQLLIVTYGSGSCPRLPNVVTGTGPHTVTITTVTYLSSTRPSCTADLGPTTSVVREPANLDETRPVTITIDGTRVGLAAR